MRVKGVVMQMLRSGDRQGMNDLVVQQPRSIRYLQGRLWDPELRVRQNAAEALGCAAAEHHELGRELLRRAMWALNDESGMNGKYALPLIGEIGHEAPELVGPFVGPMTSYLWDENLRPGILRALCRIAEVAPGLIEGVRERLEKIESPVDPDEQECLDHLLAVTGEVQNGA
jgi:hypothetical protein